MKAALLATMLAVSIASPAEARKREPPTLAERLAGAVEGFVRRAAAAAATSGAVLADASQRPPLGRREALYEDGRIVPNPDGCPKTLFCGCGVSVKVYGRPIPALYSASSWGRFPKASCGSGRVAVFSGHVAYILACNGDGTALAYDPNSGGGLTRVHTISLPSLIVEPPASL